MDNLVEDDSYALFQGFQGRNPIYDSYLKCKVVMTPFVVDRTLGGGWMFPKGSPFLPIFKHYVGLVKEGGSDKRIEDSYRGPKDLLDQECLEYDGDPIGMKKAFSLFGIILGGMGLSLIIFL